MQFLQIGFEEVDVVNRDASFKVLSSQGSSNRGGSCHEVGLDTNNKLELL